MPLGFESGVWLYLAVGAFVLGHLAVLAYFVRGQAGRSGPSMGTRPDLQVGTEPGPPADPTPDSPTGGNGDADASDELPPVDREQIVQCPHCGVKNAAEFRFCRFCIGELTGGRTVSDAGGASRDGQTF